MPRQQRVFLSYAHEDLDTVRKLYDDLKKREVNVWFDKVELKKGSWKKQIRKAITRSTDFILCLSQAALRKTGDEPGFVDDELNTAWNIAQEQSEIEFTIIPVRLEECGRGDHRLSVYQQYDLFKDRDRVLDRLAVQLGGYSLANKQAIDERSEDEKMIARLHAKAVAFYVTGEHAKTLRILDVVEDLEREVLGSISARTFANQRDALIPDWPNFATQVIQLIEQNLYDPAFNVEALISKMPMSKSVFYNQYVKTFEEKPLAQIRRLRLERAATLLRQEPDLAITEIAYGVGFTTFSYFSRCFRAHYGLTPSAFRLQ